MPLVVYPNQTLFILLLLILQIKINILNMSTFLYTLVIIFGVFGVSFILLNIRHIVTGNEFRGTCATNNPMVKDEFGDCSICGKTPEEDCKMPQID